MSIRWTPPVTFSHHRLSPREEKAYRYLRKPRKRAVFWPVMAGLAGIFAFIGVLCCLVATFIAK